MVPKPEYTTKNSRPWKCDDPYLSIRGRAARDHRKAGEANAAKDQAVLARQAERGDDTSGQPKQRYRDSVYVNPHSMANRLAKAACETSLDADAVALRKRDAKLVVHKNALGARISKAVRETIDPFGEVAATRRRASEAELAASEALDKEDAAALTKQANAERKSRSSRGDHEPAAARTASASSSSSSSRRSSAARDAHPRTHAERALEADAQYVLEQLLLPALLSEVCNAIAEDLGKKETWCQSLAGRINENIADGPLDYDALEELLRQEQLNAARRHTQERAKSNQSLGLADLASALSDLPPLPPARKPTDQDEQFSDTDSQFDVNTLVSSDSLSDLADQTHHHRPTRIPN